MTIDDYIGAPEELRAVVRSSLDANTPVGPYHMEYIWFLTFEENGRKIVKIEEYLDTKALENLQIRLREGEHQTDWEST